MRQQQQIYIPDGANSAPAKPLHDLKDLSEKEARKSIGDHALTKQLKQKYSDLINKDKDIRRDMIAVGQIIALFIQGEQILKINSFNGMPSIRKPERNDPLHIKCINDMQYYCTNWQDKWNSSKPDVLVAPFSNNDVALAKARKANTVVDHLEAGWYNNWFNLDEGLMAQVWGWYGRRVRPDFTSKSFSVFKEILGEKETQIGKGYGKCEACGYKGNDTKLKKSGKAEFNSCPKCDSLEYGYDSPVMQKYPGVVGKEKIFVPDIICEPLYFPSTIWDLSKRFEESSYAIIEKAVEESALRRIIGNIRFPAGEGENFGLDAIETLAKRGASLNGQGGASEQKEERTVLSEMYLSADDLWDIRVGGEEKTVEGHTLPKGKRMSELYPNGAYILGINGMSLILGIYAGHHSDCCASGVYHMKPMSGAGRGVGDAVEVQKQKNRRYSQIDSSFAALSTPATLMAENAIEPKYRSQLHNPKAIIPVKIQNFPEFKSLNQFIQPMQGQQIPGDIVHVTFDRLNDMMQTAYHITVLGGAKPRGISNDTATFAEIVNSNSDAIFSPVLSIKADVCVDIAKKGFYKWVRHNPEARFIPFKTKSKSGTIGEEISGKDVDGEYQWSYAQGSEAPKTRHTENQKKAAFFGLFRGGIVEYFQVKKEFPQQIAEIERDFDVDFQTDSYDAVGEVCRNRWEKAKILLSKQTRKLKTSEKTFGVAAPPDYLSLLMEIEPSIEITEPNIAEQVLWFQNLLMTDEGQLMSREERSLVSTFIMALKELVKGQAIEAQSDAAEVEIAAQEPVMEAKAAQEQAAAGQNQEMQDKQMLAEGLKVANDNEQTQIAHQANAESEDKHLALRAAEMMQEQDIQDKQHAHEQQIAQQNQAK